MLMMTRQYIRWLLISLFVLQSWGISQTDKSKTALLTSVKSLTSTVLSDMWQVASAPVRLSTGEVLRLGTFTALNLGLIYGVDGETDEEFAIKGHQALLQPAKALARVGDVYNHIGTRRAFLGLTSAALLGGVIFKDSKLLTTGRLMIESSVITGLITYWSKGFFGRSRPYTNRGATDFNLLKFSGEHQYRALPSGHTSSIFALMTVIAKQYPQWWIKYPAYTLAVSVALQRIHARQHWTSDVVVGGAIGYWVSSQLMNHSKHHSHQSHLLLYFSGQSMGMRIKL